MLPWRRATLPCVLSRPARSSPSAISPAAAALAAAPGEPSWRIVWHGRPTLTEAEALAGDAPP